ncbi:MAG TPA: UvrD-helicase domain-containing protein [Rubrobacter sp.]|nr:UvrD-helicase domain-containing protein [Rubrobacter sp.]
MLRAQEHLHGPKALRSLGEETGRPYLVRAGAVLERYIDRLKWTTMTDYEGVVQYALRLLMPGGRTAAEIFGLYDHVLVDEFQDTNRSQMELLKRLMTGRSVLFSGMRQVVVGLAAAALTYGVGLLIGTAMVG